MWKEYVGNSNGIAIISNVQRLIDEFNKSEYNIYMPKILYFDPFIDPLGIFNTIRFFCRKIDEFRYEGEIRAIIQFNLGDQVPDHLLVPVDLKYLIDKIIIKSTSSPAFESELNERLYLIGLEKKRSKSIIS